MARAIFNSLSPEAPGNEDPIIHLGRVNASAEEAPARKTIFVGIAGGTASGKTTVAEEIFERVRVGQF